jgi:hypothetical protein
MSKRSLLRAGLLLAASLTLTPGPAGSADRYEAVAEYNGPCFHAVTAPAIDQWSDDPLHEYAFENVYGVAVSIEPGGRIMNYVLDSGNRRILGYETNVDLARLASHSAGVAWTDSRTSARQWDADGINLGGWREHAGQWVVPYSESFNVNGVPWSYVADLEGYDSDAAVYTIDYDDASNAPELRVPDGALSATDTWEIVYCHTNYCGGASPAFGLGDVDQGNSDGVTVSAVSIDQAAPAVIAFQDLRDIFTIPSQSAPGTDELWLVDAADNSSGQNEELVVYTVTRDTGEEAFLEAYDDRLVDPSAVCVARTAGDLYTPPTYSALAGVPHFRAVALVDENQVTGHTYAIEMNDSLVTITDRTTNRRLVDGASKTDFVTGTTHGYVIPGLGIDFDTLVADGGTALFETERAVPSRYAFVCDRGNDRIKVIGIGDIDATAGDDLPGDAHTCAPQPSGAGTIGATQDEDYRIRTPASVPPNWKTGTVARPIQEGSLESITAEPDGTPVIWTRIDDLATSGPADRVFQLDAYEGVILFGDGVRGEVPPANTEFALAYRTTPDVMRYGATGSGAGQFSDPQAVAAVWNPGLACFAVYVADTGNHRIQKLYFHPEDASLRIPPRMEYVCAWQDATSGTDLLDGPHEIDVATDGSAYYVAVADASLRVILYRDAGFSSTGATPPDYEAAVGGAGTVIGGFGSIDGIDLARNGSELELYVADGARDYVTKFVLAPQASLALAFTGASELPRAFPPSGSYPISYAVANAPVGAYVDFYYGTRPDWSQASAELCFPAGSIGTNLGTVTWSFAASPGGVPTDGTYFVHARLMDASGNLLVADASRANETITIDSGLTTSLRVRDKADGDPTLLLAPNQECVIALEVSYPDSIVGASFVGTVPSEFLEIVGIVPGPGWERADYLQHIWNTSYDSDQGTYAVMTSILGSPMGLTTSGIAPLAYVTLRPRAGALAGATRVRSGEITLTAAQCSLTDIHGNQPSGWEVHPLDAYLAYVADIAHASSGCDSVVPHLQPRPDGALTFADQMAFTRGWNGVDNVRDRIADLGPVQGSAPNLLPAADGAYNLGDVIAFTTNWSWFAANGGSVPASPGSAGLAAFSPLGPDIDGPAEIEILSSPETALPGDPWTIEVLVADATHLMGAMVRVSYDPAAFTLREIERGELLGRDGSTLLFNTIERDGLCEICATRLDPQRPGVTGSGVLACLTFQPKAPPTQALTFACDLRDWQDRVLERGTFEAALPGGEIGDVRLCQNYPNPLQRQTSFVFSLPRRDGVDFAIYDLTGRRVKTLLRGVRDAGVHRVEWSGCDEAGAQLANGVYFYRLAASGFEETHKLLVTR